MAGAALLFPATVIAAACVVLSGGASAAPPGRVFVVGGDGPRGWSQPTGTDETYNHWASRNRFHIGDFLGEIDRSIAISITYCLLHCIRRPWW